MKNIVHTEILHPIKHSNNQSCLE